MAVKPDLPLNPLVATKCHLEAQERAKMIHQVLQSTAVLIPRRAEAFLNVVPNLSNFYYVRSEKLPEPLACCMLTGCIIQVAYQRKDVPKAKVHFVCNYT